MIIIVLFILVLILLVAFISIKSLKDKKDFEDQEPNSKKTKSKQQPVKFTEIMNENKFEILLAEARKDPEKLEILKRRIQDTLRKSVKEKNITGARTCNMQLKKIDIADRKESQN